MLSAHVEAEAARYLEARKAMIASEQKHKK